MSVVCLFNRNDTFETLFVIAVCMEQAALRLGKLLKETPAKDKKATFKQYVDISRVLQSFIGFSEMNDKERANMNVLDYFFGESLQKPV